MKSQHWHRGKLSPPIGPLADASEACRRLPGAHHWPICSSWRGCTDRAQGLCGHWAHLGCCYRSCSWRCCPALACACITVRMTLAVVSIGSCMTGLAMLRVTHNWVSAGEAACRQPDKHGLIPGNQPVSIAWTMPVRWNWGRSCDRSHLPWRESLWRVPGEWPAGCRPAAAPHR